jgi:hypothetical protein
MAFNLKIADEADASLWDKIVDSSPHGTIFHSWKWLKIVQKHSKGTFYPLIVFNGTVPIGICPLFFQKVVGVSCVFSPPPATAIPFLGPVIADFDNYKQSKQISVFKGFLQAVNDFIFSELKAKYTTILLGPSIDPRLFLWTGYKLEPLFDYTLDLRKGCDNVWKDFDRDARDHIKKAEQLIAEDPDAITVTDGTKEDVSALYDALVQRYGEQKRKVTDSKEYLLDIYDAFYPTHIKIFIVRSHGQIVNGIITIIYRNTISFWIGALKPVHKEIPSNEINHWEAIKWACKNNISFFEEYGAGTERLARSKSKYNPQLRMRFKAVKYSSAVYALGAEGYTALIRDTWGTIFTKKTHK